MTLRNASFPGYPVPDQVLAGTKDYRPKMVILVSSHDHCLVGMLYRNNAGELDCEVATIINNRVKANPLADSVGFRFTC